MPSCIPLIYPFVSFPDHHSHFHHHRSSERHSGHLQCYRSRKVCGSRHQYSERGGLGEDTVKLPDPVTPLAVTKKVPTGNSSMKRNGGIIANSSSILNVRNGNNTGLDKNHCGEAKKANPNAVLANEKKAATQLGVIVGKYQGCRRACARTEFC